MPLDSRSMTPGIPISDRHKPALILTDKQRELQGIASSHRHTMAVGGSRSGKTFGLCTFLATRALLAPGSRHLIYRAHQTDVRGAIGLDTMPKVIEQLGATHACTWNSQGGYWTFSNGSEIWLAGADGGKAQKALGKEFATVYGNEASEFSLDVRETLLSRLAQQVRRSDGSVLPLREYIDLNPTVTAHWTYPLFVRLVHPHTDEPLPEPDEYGHLYINPYDNRQNIHPDYLKTLDALGAKARKRFRDGMYLSDLENALWQRDKLRFALPPKLDRVVVAVDPAVSTTPGSDLTGVVCAGIVSERNAPVGYVLEDATGRYTPAEWAAAAMALCAKHGASAIVCERNQGGDMVKHTLRTAGYKGRILEVTAKHGKMLRAEPVAALYDLGQVFHARNAGLGTLEDQMCAMTVDFDVKAAGYSPDRVDALVYALLELFGHFMTTTTPAANAGPRITAAPKMRV